MTPASPQDGLIPLSDERAALNVIGKAVLGLWDTVNTLTRLRPTRRERYRVTIFGSARVAADHWVYGAIRDLAAELTRLGCDIVTGGGPGLMQAANEGVKLSDPDGTHQKSVGIRVELPFEQNVNAFVTDSYEHKTFFTRLHHFVLVSDAFVVTPGGIGTALEALMVWQLLQVRHLRDTPLILAGHFWDGLLAWAKDAMLRPDIPLVSPGDLDIPVVLTDGPAIVAAIRDHHARWLARQGAPA
ncbi:LOG family protein [Urbifossiella limnaea]|uniref:AMP nucleosidase n=1 Tax=Urbifossiella limnaea TaxID=2528023 RepID=A0A517XWV9_9BACT|nr:LOG family protein [Urbifossiella limnaea]QDU21993.1 putative lysine decarboxylase [Urbifossiella limnaea]